MKDRQTAAILVGVAIVAFIIWYRNRSEGERASLLGVGETAPMSKETGGREGGASAREGDTGSRISELLGFASKHGLRVTAGEEGGHNTGSLHGIGRAIDVSVRGLTEEMIDNIKRLADATGIHVLDERKRPSGQRVWTGPHLHLSFPVTRDGKVKY